MKMFDEHSFDSIGLIDTHVHRFHPNRCGGFYTVAGGNIKGPDQDKHGKQTILYNMVIEELRSEFSMSEDATADEIEAERNRRWVSDPFGYSRSLLDPQNVEMYCLEIGSPYGGPAYTDKEIADFHTVISEDKTCSIVRIDRILDDVLAQKLSFTEFSDCVHQDLRNLIIKEKTVGLKSFFACNGGLNVEIASKQDAEWSYEAIIRNPDDIVAKKKLYNYMTLDCMDEAAEFNLPLQIHTGAGGGTYLDFRTQNPVNLIDFLKDKRIFNRVKVVLLHGGHPYEEETGYLVSQFSNVYADFSGTFYLCSVKGLERMAALMEKAPLDKIMYGSDGVGMPELSWFAYRHFRRQLPKLLNSFIEGGFMTQKRAVRVAGMIMRENAFGCYENIRKYLKYGKEA